MPPRSFTHWAILCHPAWGHVRHFNGLITKILRRYRSRNIHITFLLHHTHAVKASKEILQLLQEEGEEQDEANKLMRNVRIIGLTATPELIASAEYQKLLLGSTTSIRFGMEIQSSFGHVWSDVLAAEVAGERHLKCAATDVTYDYTHWPRPAIIHTDIVSTFFDRASHLTNTTITKYGGPILKFVHDCDKHLDRHTEKVRTTCIQHPDEADPSFEIYHWSTEFISFWRMFKKDSISQGAIEIEAASALKRLPSHNHDQDAFVEICYEMYNRNVNQLLPYPGLRHGLYDHEIHPGQVGWLRTYIPALNKMKLCLEYSNGIVIASCDALQPEIQPMVRKWLMDDHNIELYAVGPAIEDNLLVENVAPSPADLQITCPTTTFLNKAYNTFGAKSVILFSWGTIWAPFRYPDILEAWLDEALSSGRPFILNRSAELFSSLSPWIEEKLNKAVASGHVHQTTWINQRAVLRHPALGVFVSHCGYSSFSESTVPIIAWPSFFDQSINAQINVDNDCGWLLVQVRGPDAAGQGHKCRMLEIRGERLIGTLEAVRQEARQVLKESRSDSDVYKRKIKNLRHIKTDMRRSMTDGMAYEDLHRLVELV